VSPIESPPLRRNVNPLRVFVGASFFPGGGGWFAGEMFVSVIVSVLPDIWKSAVADTVLPPTVPLVRVKMTSAKAVDANPIDATNPTTKPESFLLNMSISKN
jgi:hypothetical protein